MLTWLALSAVILGQSSSDESVSAWDAVTAARDPEAGFLRLVNGGIVPGVLHESPAPDGLRWRSPALRSPIEFTLGTVAEIDYPFPPTRPRPPGQYRVELTNGDILFGDLQALTAEHLVLDAASLGRLSIQCERVVRCARWDHDSRQVYIGPNGAAEWRQQPAQSWRNDGGQLRAIQDASYVHGDLGLPAQAMIEFTLSWTQRPNFALAFGVANDDDDLTYKRAYRLEVWDNELVVRCELGREADVDSVDAIGDESGRVSYVVFLDQIQGRMLVYAADGGKRAELNVMPRTLPEVGRKPRRGPTETPPEPNPSRTRPIHPGVRLTNKHGDIRLERLQITHWNGQHRGLPAPGRSCAHLLNDRVVDGEITAFNATTQQFTLHSADGDVAIAERDLKEFLWSRALEEQPKPVRVVYQDGTRLAGQLLRVDADHIHLRHVAFTEELPLPRKNVQSITIAQSTPPDPAALENRKQRSGRLEIDGLKLPGRFVDGTPADAAGTLWWLADGSPQAVALRTDVQGRIVFRDPPPPVRPVVASSTAAPQVGLAKIRQAVPAATKVAQQPVERTARSPAIYLRSGDNIPCQVLRIDEQGVTLTTSLDDKTFVPHSKIKAIELDASRSSRLDDRKRARLLMLPRGQRDAPPTQLIAAEDGDFLRGRIVSMDETTLVVELRLETREIPRNRIAQLIWLHPDEWSDAPADSAEARPIPPLRMRVQTLRSNGNRLTFFAERLTGSILSGASDVLGACRVDLEDVDQLLIGQAIELAAAALTHQQWRLHTAAEPLGSEEMAQSGSDGITSPLIGKPAPGVSLDLLGGGRFELAECRGQIVILDFWATWCGPCLRSLPVVTDIANEFREAGVQFVAVNLEERPREIEASLARHQLSLTVAMDKDGAVATKYQASAIPQTVVIDRDGNIARLFVGGGPHFAEELREALRSLTMPKP